MANGHLQADYPELRNGAPGTQSCVPQGSGPLRGIRARLELNQDGARAIASGLRRLGARRGWQDRAAVTGLP